MVAQDHFLVDDRMVQLPAGKKLSLNAFSHFCTSCLMGEGSSAQGEICPCHSKVKYWWNQWKGGWFVWSGLRLPFSAISCGLGWSYPQTMLRCIPIKWFLHCLYRSWGRVNLGKERCWCAFLVFASIWLVIFTKWLSCWWYLLSRNLKLSPISTSAPSI